MNHIIPVTFGDTRKEFPVTQYFVRGPINLSEKLLKSGRAKPHCAIKVTNKLPRTFFVLETEPDSQLSGQSHTEREYTIRLPILQIATIILIAANVCACSRLAQSSAAQKYNPPAGWQPVTVGSLTVYVPPDMTEQETAQKTEKQRIFDNGKLSISISYGTTNLDTLMQLLNAKAELKEEIADIGGKKVNLFTFLMTPIPIDKPIPPRRSDPNKLLHRAVAFFPTPLNNDQNYILWAECENAASQALAKEIFQTATFQ